jgi:cytochrome c oxidase cbb3-type subunit 3
MSSAWSWFVILGTVLSLVGVLAFLLSNRSTSGQETTGHDYDGIQEFDNPLPMWWVGMFIVSILFAGGYLVYYPGLGNFGGVGNWSSADQVAREQQAHEQRFAPLYARLAQLDEAGLHADRQAQQVGRRLFINNCSTCHGVTGQGAFGFPNLTDDEWIWGKGFDNVKTALANGRQAAMPPWGAALGDQGVVDVAQYVLSLSGSPHDADAAARGASQFATFCVACHGPEGRGNPVLGAPDLTNDIWLYGGTADAIAFTLRHGRNGNMPSFARVLDPGQIHIVAGYVTSLGQQ